MKINLRVNQKEHVLDIQPGETLLNVLRGLGYYGVKHGCESGECGACAVLLDGRVVNSCLLLAAQAEGHVLETVENLGQHPQQGWKTTEGLHPLQTAFVENGAIQCGYCTPAQILAAKQLLAANPNPTEAEVREALAGVLCRCTGYVKPVQAVLKAAAVLRGEPVEAGGPVSWLMGEKPEGPALPLGEGRAGFVQRSAWGRIPGSWSPGNNRASAAKNRPYGAGETFPGGGKRGDQGGCGKTGAGKTCLHRGYEHAGDAGGEGAAQPTRPCPHPADRCQPGAGIARCGCGADLAGPAAGGVFDCRAV